MLHAKGSWCALLSNIQHFKFCLNSSKFCFTLLVELYLSCSVRTCCLKTRSNVFNVLFEHCTTFLCFCSCTSFDNKLFIKLFKSSKKFLCLFCILGSQSSLIINLCTKCTSFFIFASNSTTKFCLNSLQIRNSFLGELQITFNFSFGFFNITLDLLFSFKCIFSFIESLFKLSFYS